MSFKRIYLDIVFLDNNISMYRGDLLHTVAKVNCAQSNDQTKKYHPWPALESNLFPIRVFWLFAIPIFFICTTALKNLTSSFLKTNSIFVFIYWAIINYHLFFDFFVPILSPDLWKVKLIFMIKVRSVISYHVFFRTIIFGCGPKFDFLKPVLTFLINHMK